MNPVDTLFVQGPAAVGAQSGFVHKALEAMGIGLEFAAETFILLNTANIAIQSVDSTIDMIRQTKHDTLKLKDAR